MKTAFASLLVTLTGVVFLWNTTDGLRALTAEGARRLAVVSNTPEVPDLMLETAEGTFKPLRPSKNKVLVSEFIYTTCPVICQTNGSYLAQLKNQVARENLGDRVEIISISFDPEKDDPEQLAYYARQHGAGGQVWSVARPDKADLPILLKTFGIVVIPDGFGGYEHNSAMHIVNGEGRLAEIVDSNDVTGALSSIKRVLFQ